LIGDLIIELLILEHRLFVTNFLHFLTKEFLSLIADVPLNKRLTTVAYLSFSQVRAYSNRSCVSLCIDCAAQVQALLDSVLWGFYRNQIRMRICLIKIHRNVEGVRNIKQKMEQLVRIDVLLYLLHLHVEVEPIYETRRSSCPCA
jgi:hypothetical protein